MATDLTGETDVGLLLLIGGAADTPAEQALARESLAELHARHHGYVLRVLERYTETAGTLAIDPKEWASKTFMKAFRNAASFTDRSGGDAAVGAAQVRAWLGQMAQRAALDELKRLNRERQHFPVTELEEFHESCMAAPDFDPTVPASRTAPERLKRVQEVLDSLKPAELEIVNAYVGFGVPTAVGRELPTDIRQALELSTGYERSTIRQKWNRLSKRLREQLEPHVPNQ